ncbi:MULTISPECIES: type-F conjugative transfer system pilin assembly protein TrbC [Legionella]|nr:MULTISPECIES: type-F conjugative transfer system pilin assembly protein TrbC [Legionella]MCE3043692.1 type-F conjugative transfer system pilin assembly protein TrbC [Legionella sp. 16cNR16C]
MSSLMITTGHANVNDHLNEALETSEQQQSTIPKEVLMQLNQSSNQSYDANRTLIENIIQSTQKQTAHVRTGQTVDGAVLFVSFSMPDALLFALADEAASYKIPVVINGLIEGDFKKTITAFSKLNAKAKQQKLAFNGVSVDPLWFEQFHITAVPALVVSKRPVSCGQQLLCKEQPFDVVYGNASIKNSLQLIADKGETAAKVAQLILEKGHV